MSLFDWGTALPELNGQRLNLRWLTQDDAPALFSIFGDPEVTKYWGEPPLGDLDAAARLVDQIHQLFRERSLFQWGVERHSDGQLIGTCTLLKIEERHRRAEVGFALARSAWGGGFATESVGLLIGFAFDTLGLHRLEADVDPLNEASLRLLERQGFQREGYMRERWSENSAFADSVFLGLLRHEWIPPGQQTR